MGFYKGKCGFRDVESIVAGVVADAVENDGTLVAALLRLQFHDCFVSVSCLLVCVFVSCCCCGWCLNVLCLNFEGMRRFPTPRWER